MLFKKNFFTIAASVVGFVLVFVILINVLSFQNRLITVSKQDITEPPAEPVVEEPVQSEPDVQITHLTTYTPPERVKVTFEMPEGVSVDRLMQLNGGSVEKEISFALVDMNGELLFALNLDEGIVIDGITAGNEVPELVYGDNTLHPVYRLTDISSQTTVVIQAHKEETPEEEPVHIPTPTTEQEIIYTWKVTVHDPTCTEKGYTHYDCVEDPSRSFSDSWVKALGHNYKKNKNGIPICTRCGQQDPSFQYTWTVIVHEPTCTEGGYTEHICKEDKSKNYVDHVTAPLGHDLDMSTAFTGSAYCKRCHKWINIASAGSNNIHAVIL